MGQVARETYNGMKWMMLQKFTMQPLQLIYSMFLARLVTPEEIGILGLTSIFFAIAGQLASCGFASALIRKQDRTVEDINTMFWFNTGMSFLMAIVIFISAPLFVIFFNQPTLLWLTRASAIMLFVNSLGSVHWTLYTARRDFKTPAIIQTCVSLLSMPLCIGLAFVGWGAWAIMAQSIVGGLICLVTVWILSPWKPHLIFSIQSFKEMFGYGSKLAVSGLINTVYNNVRNLIIGKFYTPADLAYYSRGQHLAEVIPSTVCSMLSTVTFPILATLQDEPDKLRHVYRKYLRLFTLSITWVCLCVAAYAKPFVAIMYGEQWNSAVIYTQLVCFSYAIFHIHVINLNLLQVLGRSDLFLRLEIVKKILSVSVLLFCATISVVAICIGAIITSYLCLYINSYYSKKLINMTIWQQLMDYIPLFLLAFVSTWLPANFIINLPIWPITQLAIGGTISFCIYFSVLYLAKNQSLNETLRILHSKLPLKSLQHIAEYFIRPKQ